MPGELKFRIEQSVELVTIYISGEVDIYTSQELKDTLYNIVDQNKTDLKINCKELTYMDSTGLGIFVGALKRVKQYEKKVYICNLRDNMKKLFSITGLDKVFIIEE